MLRSIALGALGALSYLTAASAHVDVEPRQAPIGGSFKGAFRLSHGCDGSATLKMRMRIPPGFLNVRPMAKPGWKIDVTNGKYPKSFDLRGVKIEEGVTDVAWSDGNLPDAQFDEFVILGYLSGDLKAGTSMYFPIIQECEKGVHRWIEIPSGPKEPPEPAAELRLLPRR